MSQNIVKNSFIVATALLAVLLIVLPLMAPAALAQRTCRDGTPPPCKPEGGEAGANNLSYPVILSDGYGPGGFPADTAWTFRTIVDLATDCTMGVLPGTPVPDNVACYYDGSQVWWLSQRQSLGNFWKTFSTADPVPASRVVVTALDWGDLLESSPRLNTRRIRTEMTLYKDATGSVDGDADFNGFIAGFPQVYPFSAPCVDPGANAGVGCFAAFGMSDAVPGTEQSINEMQGTDFGFDTVAKAEAHATATGALVDPTLVKFASSAHDIDGNLASVPLPLGFHATVYSRCARLVIQKINLPGAEVTWDPARHVWGPWPDVASPAVDIKAWQDGYSAEINASGTLIYGFNWNARLWDSGLWRLTFVLDNGVNGLPDPTGEHCEVLPNTLFTSNTLVANPARSPSRRSFPTATAVSEQIRTWRASATSTSRSRPAEEAAGDRNGSPGAGKRSRFPASSSTEDSREEVEP